MENGLLVGFVARKLSFPKAGPRTRRWEKRTELWRRGNT